MKATSATLQLQSVFQSLINDHKPEPRTAALAVYEAGQPSRTRSQATRYNSNPNTIGSLIERTWASWNGEYVAKNSPFGVNYIRKRRVYASPIGWIPNTGDTTLNRDVAAYIDEWAEDAGVDQSAWMAFSRMADVELPARGDSALLWYRDEERLRLLEVTGDQIGEMNYYMTPVNTRAGMNGETWRYFAGIYLGPGGLRKGYRIFEKGHNEVYCNPQDYDADDVIFFKDNLFNGVRGMTIFHAAIVSMVKKDQLFQFGMDSAQKQAKTGVVIRNEFGGPTSEYSYDASTDIDGNTIYIEKTFDGAETQYQYNGDSYEVIRTQAPGPELIEGCRYASEEAALSLGFPYSFLVNARDVGGAPSRFEISLASKEIIRIRTLHTRQLKQVVKMALLDAIDRRVFRGAALTANLWKGEPKFSSLPTADSFREDQQNIAMNRAGCMSRQDIVAADNKRIEDVISQNAHEAMLAERATQDANRTLKKLLSPVDGLPYEPNITIADIAQNSDNVMASAQAEQTTGIAPGIPSSGKQQVTDNPPNVTAAMASGEDGQWITTDKGAHIFIKKGGTLDDAISNLDSSLKNPSKNTQAPKEEMGIGADGKEKPVSQMSKGEKRTHDLKKKLEKIQSGNADKAKSLAEARANIESLKSELSKPLPKNSGNEELKSRIESTQKRLEEVILSTQTIEHALRNEDKAADEFGEDSQEHNSAQRRTSYVARPKE